MRVLLVANDKAPVAALVKLAEALVGRGHAVYDLWPLNVKPDIVCLGMSSSPDLAAREMFNADLARKQGIRYGFYADTYGVHNRPWFESVRDKASFIFVINEEEARGAQKSFPNAEVVVSGNPLWDDFFFPKFSRAEVRGQLGVSEEKKVILCPGTKTRAVNVLLIGGIIEAVHLLCLEAEKNWEIIFAKHPGETTPSDIYNELAAFSKVRLKVIEREFSGSDLVPGCDLVIESASTIGIEAACQRKPVIDYFTEVGLANLERQIAARKWQPCEIGIVKAVYGNSHALTNAIWDLTSGGGGKNLRERQEALLPMPVCRGEALEKMVSTLRRFGI